MSIVGFQFTGIQAKRTGPAAGKINVSNNVKMLDVSEHELTIKAPGKKGAKVEFAYIVDYEPKIGSMQINGHVLLLAEEKQINEMMDNWKQKKIEQHIMVKLLNSVLQKCNVKALVLSQEVGLPAPFKIPIAKTA